MGQVPWLIPSDKSFCGLEGGILDASHLVLVPSSILPQFVQETKHSSKANAVDIAEAMKENAKQVYLCPCGAMFTDGIQRVFSSQLEKRLRFFGPLTFKLRRSPPENLLTWMH
jgi:hypothetical protein